MQNEQINNYAIEYANRLWPEIESYFHVLIHSDDLLMSSHKGAHEVIWIFKDWVENNITGSGSASRGTLHI